MSVLLGARSSVVVTVLAVSLLVWLPSGMGHVDGTPAAPWTPPLVQCMGASLPDQYSGTLALEGGPLAPSTIANVSLTYGFDVETTWRNQTTGAVTATGCERGQGSATTSPNGSFSMALALPGSSCDQWDGLCASSTGPYGPFSVAPLLGAPSGYSTSVNVSGSRAHLAFVADLASLTAVVPGASPVYSPGATESIGVLAETGNGSVTTEVPQYRWTLTGVGWSFRSLPTGEVANVTAAPGAGAGTLEVSAHLSVGSTTLSAGPAYVSLTALSTAISAVHENRSTVDAGHAIIVTVSGSGAPGYNYTAHVVPGSGAAPTALACESQSTLAGPVSVVCSGPVTYGTPGTDTPVAEISNGYSAAEYALPPVTVTAPPSVRLSAASYVGYVGESVTVGLATDAGAGPYTEACFDPGDGGSVCTSGPGPNWTFRPVYSEAAQYTATASVRDGDGVTSSLPVGVTIALPPELGTLVADPSSPTQGSLVQLAATYTGGFLPAEYYWNLSGSNRSLGVGPLSADGTVTSEWIPSLPGPQYVTLTVVDALGTARQSIVFLPVQPAPVTMLPAVELPPGDVGTAGAAIGLAWQAYTADGQVAATFSPSAELRLTTPDGGPTDGAWLNASGVGPLVAVAPGTFELPSGAWSLGRLALTLAVTTVGAVEVSVVGSNIPASAAAPRLEVGPDLAHLGLSDPLVTLAGIRTNATFWEVRDRFGNPAVGATLQVTVESAGTTTASVVPAGPGPGGRFGAWVNYSLPGSAGGWLEVSSGDRVLLGPIQLAAPDPTPPGAPVPFVIVGAALAAALVPGSWLVARRRARRLELRSTEDESETGLREFVAGRDRVIAAVRDAGAADLARIEASWAPTSAPGEVPDWIASLVADGTLGARTGPDGVARFCLAGPVAGPAHVVLDEAALERAERTRAELTGGPEASEPERDRRD